MFLTFARLWYTAILQRVYIRAGGKRWIFIVLCQSRKVKVAICHTLCLLWSPEKTGLKNLYCWSCRAVTLFCHNSHRRRESLWHVRRWILIRSCHECLHLFSLCLLLFHSTRTLTSLVNSENGCQNMPKQVIASSLQKCNRLVRWERTAVNSIDSKQRSMLRAS